MKQYNLTEGPIRPRLLGYFLPIAAGTLFQQLYNAADAVIVGKFVGTVALAAVGGSAANIVNILIGFFVALSGGASVLIAQVYGARNDKVLRKAVGTAVTFCVLAGAALMAVGLASARPLLRLLRTPEDTVEPAAVYLRIVFCGVIAQLLYNMEAGILRAVGDSRSPFLYLLVSCLSNVGLDLLFVVRFGWGVTGVAVATVMAQVLSMALATVKLLRAKASFRIDVTALGIDRPLLRRMMRVGIPAGLEQSVYSVTNTLLQVVVNGMGTVVVAAWSLAGKLDGFYWATISAAGTSVMNFSAQNYGAGRQERVGEGLKTALVTYSVMTVFFSVLLYTLSPALLPFFSDDADVVAVTLEMIRFFCPYYVTWTVLEMISGTLRGMGDAVGPVVICSLSICVFRVIWLFTAFRLNPGVPMLCLCYPVSWVLADIAFILYYKRGRWKKRLVSAL